MDELDNEHHTRKISQSLQQIRDTESEGVQWVNQILDVNKKPIIKEKSF